MLYIRGGHANIVTVQRQWNSRMIECPEPMAGVVFRIYRDASDIAALMGIRAEIQVDPEWGWMPTADQFVAGSDSDDPQPTRDVLIAEADGERIGFTWLTRW